MLKGQVLYSKPSGSQVIFDEIKNDVIYAHVESGGYQYDSKPITGILAKGYWNEVYISTDVELIEKHLPGGHDQATHGSWASGEELSAWDPHAPIPGSPRNAGGMTARMWDLWEHGPDGDQYVELYRQYAGEALGIPVPKSPMDVGGWNHFITKPGYGGSSVETARKDAVAIVNAIANGKPEQPALYRGMTATDENEKALLDSITNLKPGDTLDMPLVSTTRSLGVAAWYAGDRSSKGEGNVIMKIQPGAKGVSVKPENSWYPHDHEVITSGKFEIVSVTTVEAPYWKRGTFEPRKLEFRPEYGGTSYEVATYGPKTYTVEESKAAYDAVSSGNWGSLETPTFKLTDDRREGRTFKTLSSWEKQEPRQFTVVEVKMVGDHVVEKADSTDYGLTFDALFNKVPFIRNEEDVQKAAEELEPHICLGRGGSFAKHNPGTHDQSTHGSWATGKFGPDSVKSARDGAKEYSYKAGIERDDSIDYTKTVANRARAAAIADAYDELPVNDPEAHAAYDALSSEVQAQFDYMTKTMGIKVEFVDADPYKNSKEMFADASKGVLKVLKTSSTGSHPYLTDEQNDMFRAVHDFFGHAATGRGFGQDGEESAWVHHSQMFTETARGALTTETRGQNSWYNSRGKEFATQKVALLPREYWEVPKVFEKRVIRFAPGLKPVLKHGEHDQSTHGNWATQGYTAEEEARISEMSSMGPALEDLDAILDSAKSEGTEPTTEDLRLIVENDQRHYFNAIDGDIEDVVEERIKNLQEEFPNHEYTEQEKSTIYEDVQREMIDKYIEDNFEDLSAEFSSSREGEDTQTLLDQAHAFFDDVYTYSYEVKGPDGESGTMESTVNAVEIGDHPYDGSQNAIKLSGSVQFDGDYAGEFERTFWKDENGNWNVEHDLFRMEEEFQGTGFGKDFIQRQEDWYTAAGFNSIEVGTGWDGARHWARAGYDFNERYQEANMNSLVSSMNFQSDYSDSFKPGSPERAEFDSLMGRATVDYVSDEDGGQFTAIRSMDMPTNDVPIPNDFAMIGYDRRTSYEYTDALGKKRTGYDWAGKTLMQDLNLKYKKGLTAEGRSIIAGPIDRDGDGMVYDGTIREKPASRVNS